MVVVILAVFIARLVSLNDPEEIKAILTDEKIESDIEKLGGDFLIYKITLRNAFSVQDAFFVNNVVYLESSRSLQMTLRCKKNRFADINEVLKAGKEDYDSLLNLYLRVTQKSENGGDDITEIKEADKKYRFENKNYEYIRVSFSGVNIDYVNSKAELFLYPKSADGAAVFESYNEEDIIAQFNIFDINMPKSKVNIKDFQLLRQ